MRRRRLLFESVQKPMEFMKTMQTVETVETVLQAVETVVETVGIRVTIPWKPLIFS